MINQDQEILIPDHVEPDRADRVLAENSTDISRSAIARLMKLGLVLKDNVQLRPATLLKGGDTVQILAEETITRTSGIIVEFGIIHEDEDVIVIDKPAGLVVHPGAGHVDDTLMDQLVAERRYMIGVGAPDRWGIVHRLDRDTSGVMVVAKNQKSLQHLFAQFKVHSVHRKYIAVAKGNPGEDSGFIELPIGRHSKDRKRISISTNKARYAATGWKVLERFKGFVLLEITPKTGRTHQIRVHLSSSGLPIIGDQVYGKARQSQIIKDKRIRAALDSIKRQALHAAVLGFINPGNGQYVEFSSPLPEDMAAVCDLLRAPLHK